MNPRAGSTDQSEAAAITDAERIRKLERENDGLVSRFRFVDDTRTDYPVKRLCEVLKINRYSYYKRKATAQPRSRVAGVSPSSAALARVVTMRAAAPSFWPEALPAVTAASSS